MVPIGLIDCLVIKHFIIMNRIRFFIIFSLIAVSLSGQAFKASAVTGVNISQLDGDNQAGYHKWGVTAGTRVSYEVYKKMDVSIEFLYSQRGSRSTSDFNPFVIQLNYLELPLIYSLKDWYDEKNKFYKARADLGLSYGYLFSSTENIDGFEDALENLKKNDLSFILGVGLNFNKRWGIGIRYTRSLIKLYEDGAAEETGWVSYFLTARAEYNF